MDIYERVAYSISQNITSAYSTSFGLSSMLFHSSIRKHIYAIYGLVRMADEIVDTFKGGDSTKASLLQELESEVYKAIKRGYSTNPIVHSFALTARLFNIQNEHVKAFFSSMRMDIGKQYNEKLYAAYIYGSAEAVGLMCLSVFCEGDNKLFIDLEHGARLLGSAFQKINFLRDFSADYNNLGRIYFPSVTYETFDDEQKQQIEREISQDFTESKIYIDRLPISARSAVMTSWFYYRALLNKIQASPADAIKKERIRINNFHKIWLLLIGFIRGVI